MMLGSPTVFLSLNGTGELRFNLRKGHNGNATFALQVLKRSTLNVFSTFAVKPRPESGLDCLICATFARQRIDLPQGAGVYKVVSPPSSSFLKMELLDLELVMVSRVAK